MLNYNIGLMAENYSNEILYKNNSLTHDNFITNLNGTSPSEVFFMTFVVPASSLCLFILPSIPLPFLGYYGSNVLKAAFLNFVLLFALTVWSDYVAAILWSLFIFILTTAFFIYKSQSPFSVLTTGDQQNAEKSSNGEFLNKRLTVWQIPIKNYGDHVAFIADYRGHMLLATAISILAVDFPVFPRKFAKTENYGWSIMDAGVGCFVAVHGICSPYSRKISNGSFHILKSVKSSFPLLVLGFVRLAAVKAVNYHEHVSEYGIHWNFFFTLAVTKILCSVVLAVFCFRIRSGILAVIFAILHQFLLSVMGVSEFVNCESRETFLQANKEGISSILGFVVIYFIGVELGNFLRRPRSQLQEWIHVFAFLVITGCVGWMAMYVVHFTVQPISRKLANLPYCIWIMALTSLQLAVHLTEQLLSTFHELTQCKLGDSVSSTNDSTKNSAMKSFFLWKAINENGLVYFLLANILTGIVNIVMDTVNASNCLSLFVLSIYTFVLMSIILMLSRFSIHLKFW